MKKATFGLTYTY